MLSTLSGFILIAILGATLTVWTGHNTDRVRRDNMLRQTRMAAAAITPEAVSRLTATAADTESPDYRALCEQLRRTRSASADIRFVYLLTQRNGHIVFLAESEPEDSADHSPPGMVYEEASEELKASCGTGRSFTEGPLTDQYGVWVSTFAPVRATTTGETLAELGMDCDARNWRMAILRSQLLPLLITLLAAILWGVLVVWLRSMQSSADRILASERNLRLSEERLKSALSGAQQSLWDWNLRDSTLFFDSHWGPLLGADQSGAPTSMDAWRDMIHPDDVAEVLTAMRAAQTSTEAQPFESEYRVRVKSGDWIWILDRARVIKDEANGQLVRMTGTIQNITTRKQANQMLQDRADQLERLNRLLNTREGRIAELKGEVNTLCMSLDREPKFGKNLQTEQTTGTGTPEPSDGLRENMISVMEDLEMTNRHLQNEISEHRQTEDKLRELSQAVEQSPVSVVITDLNGVILYVNPTFTTVSGFTADEAIGRTPAMLKSGKQPPEFYRQLWETIRAGQTWRGDFENRRKDGSAFWELAVISPILDPNGRIVRFLAVKQDVTERRKADEQMRRTAAEMEQMNRLMTGREERVLELKAEVNELCRALGRKDSYRISKTSGTVQDPTSP